jgi:thiol-disulfide isomerase/thioredoxin
MKRIYFVLIPALILAACHNKHSFSISGALKDNKAKYIYLHKVDVNTPVLIDSAKISKKGAFHFSVESTGPDFYQLGFSTSNFITLLTEPGEKITLNFRNKNLFENYDITGSEGSSKLKELDVTLADTKRKLDSLSLLYSKAAEEPDFATRGPELEAEYSKLIKGQRKKNIEFIIKNINSLAAIKALYQTITTDTYVLYEPNDLQYLKIVTDSLTKHYPASRHVQALAQDLNNELNKMYVRKIGELANAMPQAKLDPDLMDTEGRRIALSSLRGKYVLLSFWSYRSKECINENLQMKELYKLYNKKGFEIYQINLDDNEDGWRQAVKFDELPWISTREDDPNNLVNARMFNVTNLPANFLFDREGNIIGSNLHGRVLQVKLEQIFQK